MSEAVNDVSTWATLIGFLIFTIALVTVIVLMFRRGHIKNVPFMIKIALLGFVIVQLLTMVGVLIILINGKPNDALGFTLLGTFDSVHWIFASHYLQVAVMFRLTFSGQNESFEEKFNRRRRCLIALDVCIYLTIPVLVFLSNYLDATLIIFAIWTALLWLIGLVTLVALAYIQHQ